MVPASHVHEWSPQVILECTLLFTLRGLFAPWLLLRYARDNHDDGEFSLIGKNIFQWSIAALLLASAFVLGGKLAPDDSYEALQVGTAAGCVMIGMLVLSNQNKRLGQAIGLLTIESGMALVELLSPHAMPIPVSVGVNLVYVTLLITMGLYLKRGAESSQEPQLVNKGQA